MSKKKIKKKEVKEDFEDEIFDEEENDFSETENETDDDDNGEPKYKIGHVVELEYTVQLGKEEPTDKIVFQNPLTFEMVDHLPVGNMKNLKLGNLRPIICKMTGELTAIVKKLHWEDAQTCVEVVSFFLSVGPKTGRN